MSKGDFMKKILQLTLACTALSVALLGCGGGGGGGGNDLGPITSPGANYVGSYSGKFSPTPSYIQLLLLHLTKNGE